MRGNNYSSKDAVKYSMETITNELIQKGNAIIKSEIKEDKSTI